jgi:hypothetical protein
MDLDDDIDMDLHQVDNMVIWILLALLLLLWLLVLPLLWCCESCDL